MNFETGTEDPELEGEQVEIKRKHYPLYEFDLRAMHARTLLPAALASVSFGFVLDRVRVLVN